MTRTEQLNLMNWLGSLPEKQLPEVFANALASAQASRVESLTEHAQDALFKPCEKFNAMLGAELLEILIEYAQDQDDYPENQSAEDAA